MRLHQKQKEIVKCPSRFRVVNAGRRFGKTVLSVEELVYAAATNNEGSVLYVASTYAQAREISWEMLKKRVGDVDTGYINESRLELSIPNKYGTRSKITLKGWESIESARGQSFVFVVLDEVAMYRNFEMMWKEVIRPTLTDRRGRALFISTPKGFNHWYDLFNKEKEDKDYKSFHFTSYDNPHLPVEEIEKAKIELGEDSFAQEYLADFRQVSGLVCKWFSRDVHLKEKTFVNAWYEAIDGGWRDPTAYLLIAEANGHFYVTDGFRKPELKTDEIIHLRNFLCEENGADPVGGIGDADDPRLLDELVDSEIIISPVEKIKGEKDRTLDETLARRLESFGRKEDPKLFIAPHLTWLIEEIETLLWAEKKDGEYLVTWDDHRRYGHHYDGVRALAYFLLEVSNPENTLGYTAPAEPKVDPVRYDPDEALEARSNPWKSV